MSPEKLAATVKELKRFLTAAETLRHVRGNDPSAYSHPREQGAVRRASLDLTRSLADLRKP